MKTVKAPTDLIEALISAGLDPETGKSGWMAVNVIEAYYGKRIVGNGSKIRRDVQPFTHLNYSKEMDGPSIVAFRFEGFKTVNELLEQIDEQNENSLAKIRGIAATVRERQQERAKWVEDYPSLNTIVKVNLFSVREG